MSQRFLNGQKTVARAAEIDKRRLQSRQYVYDFSFVNIARNIRRLLIFDVVFLKFAAFNQRNAGHIRFDVYQNQTCFHFCTDKNLFYSVIISYFVA